MTYIYITVYMAYTECLGPGTCFDFEDFIIFGPQELQILKRSLESQEDAQELMNQKLTMLQTTAKAKMQEKLTPVIKRRVRART